MNIREYLRSIGCKAFDIERDPSYRKLVYFGANLEAWVYSVKQFQTINNPSPKLLIKLYRLGMLTNV